LADAIVAQIVKWGFGYFNIEKQEWQDIYRSNCRRSKSSIARELIDKSDRQL
jgi:hypothetical protein